MVEYPTRRREYRAAISVHQPSGWQGILSLIHSFGGRGSPRF
jgi:hypothetical protein